MNYQDQPLVQALIDFKQTNPHTFHVPGHKNGLLSGMPTDFRSALPYDLTELQGLDDLHEPTGVIKDAQQKLMDLYGSDKSFFLVNGSTVGNLAMIYATCDSGDTVIVQRNAHKSIFHAIELTKAHPVLVSPEWDPYTKTFGMVSPKQIQLALLQYPEAKSVVLTYPTYYGTTGEGLAETIQYCHAKKIPVLVDEAHGAHFVIGEPFPKSALSLGADVVVHSAHKTLPAMTMASFLHIKSNLVSVERLAHALHMLQSSSPSYLLMASLDHARAYAEGYNDQDKQHFIEQRQAFIQSLKKVPQLTIIKTEDPLKLIVRVKDYSGFDFINQLKNEGIYAELADPTQVLLILPLIKTEHTQFFDDIVLKFQQAVNQLLQSCEKTTTINDYPGVVLESISQLHYSPTELSMMELEWVDYKKAEGAIAAAAIIPYPPGIPLILGGEQVTREHVAALQTYIQLGAKIQGAIRMDEMKIQVVNREVEE